MNLNQDTLQAGIYCSTSNFLKLPCGPSLLAYLWQFIFTIFSQEKSRDIFLYCWLLQMRQLFLHYHSHRKEIAWGTLSFPQGAAEINTAFSYLGTQHYPNVSNERIQPMVHSKWQLPCKRPVIVFYVQLCFCDTTVILRGLKIFCQNHLL